MNLNFSDFALQDAFFINLPPLNVDFQIYYRDLLDSGIYAYAVAYNKLLCTNLNNNTWKNGVRLLNILDPNIKTIIESTTNFTYGNVIGNYLLGVRLPSHISMRYAVFDIPPYLSSAHFKNALYINLDNKFSYYFMRFITKYRTRENKALYVANNSRENRYIVRSGYTSSNLRSILKSYLQAGKLVEEGMNYLIFNDNFDKKFKSYHAFKLNPRENLTTQLNLALMSTKIPRNKITYSGFIFDYLVFAEQS